MRRDYNYKELPEEAVELLEGIGDGLIAILPEAFFNGTILERLSATGLLGGVMVLAEASSGVEGGEPSDENRRLSSSSLSSSPSPSPSLLSSAGRGLSGGYEGFLSNPDVKTPQVHGSSIYKYPGHIRTYIYICTAVFCRPGAVHSTCTCFYVPLCFVIRFLQVCVFCCLFCQRERERTFPLRRFASGENRVLPFEMQYMCTPLQL